MSLLSGRILLLAALSALVAALAASGIVPTWPGLIHLVALPPLDLFADLRWITARAPSYPVFLLAAAASVAFRTAFLAALLPGAWRRRLKLAATVQAVALGPALVAAMLSFASFGTLYHAPFWGTLILVAGAAFLLAPATFAGADRLQEGWRRALAYRLHAGTVTVYLLLLAALGAAAGEPGDVRALAAIPVSAALTWGAIALLSRPPPEAWRRAGVAVPLVLVVGVAATTMTGPASMPGPAEREGSLFLMAGVDNRSGKGTMFGFDPRWLGFTCADTIYYSYAGRGEGAPQRDAICPITSGAPFEPPDTQRPFEDLVATFIEQVRELEPPVIVLAHSQAGWIAWEALARHDDLGISEFVLLVVPPESPLVYPRPGETGQGRVGGDAFRALAALVRPLGFDYGPDRPLAHDLLTEPDALAGVLAQDISGAVRALNLASTFDLALMPRGPEIRGAREACPQPVGHAGFPLADEAVAEINRFLRGEPEPPCPPWNRIGALGRSFAPPPWDA